MEMTPILHLKLLLALRSSLTAYGFVCILGYQNARHLIFLELTGNIL